MTDTQTIRSFLVSLGFKVDQGSETRFKESVESATRGVMAMGAAIAAAAVAVAAATAKMAVDFDNLYFSSQRTGASVGTIKAFGYAVSQLGGTAEGASSSLENLARKMRESPGIRQQINSMTGAGIGPDGKISAEQIEKIGDAFRRMPSYRRQAMAEAWGIDEKTMLAMVAGVDKFTAEYKKKMKEAGLDPEKAAEDGHKFMVAWRSIWATFGNVVDGALSKLMGTEGNGLIAFGAWFDKHSKEISDALSEMAKGFLSAFSGWQNGLGSLDWKTIGADVGIVARAFGLLVKALADLVVLLTNHPILGGMLGGAFIGSRGGIYGAIAGGVAGGAAGAYLSDPAGADAAAGGAGNMLSRAWNWTKRQFGMGAKADTGPIGRDTGPLSSAGNLTKLINEEAARAGIDPRIMEGIRAGESAHGNHYDVKDDALESSWGPFQLNRRRGLGVDFERETGLDVRNPATIAAQARWVARYIKKHGGANGQWMGYRGPRDADPRWGDSGYKPAPTVVAPKTPPATAPTAAHWPNNYDPNAWWRHVKAAPAPGQQSSIDNSSSSAATLHANTTINVTGGADPAEVGAHVARAQSRQNANLIRNLQGAVA